MAEFLTHGAHETTQSVGPSIFLLDNNVLDADGNGYRRISADGLVNDTTVVRIAQGTTAEIVRVLINTKGGAQEQITVTELIRSTTGGLITFPAGTKDVYPVLDPSQVVLTNVENTFGDDQDLKYSDPDTNVLGPRIRMWRSYASPVADARGPGLALAWSNTAGTARSGLYVEGRFSDPTDTSEDSYSDFYTYSAGVQAVVLRLAGDEAAFFKRVAMNGQQVRLHGENIYLFGQATGELDIHHGAVRRIRLTGSGNLILGDDAASGGQKLQVYATSNNQCSLIEAQHAAFVGDVIRAHTTRTAAIDFNLMTLRTSGGSDVKFRVGGEVSGTGFIVFADGNFTGGGAGPGDLFEWADGNPPLPDGTRDHRLGWAVVLDEGGGGMIRIATESDDPEAIIGATSATATVAGDNPIDWHAKWLTDEFGVRLKDARGRSRLNPAYRWQQASPVMLDPETGEVIEEEIEEEVGAEGGDGARAAAGVAPMPPPDRPDPVRAAPPHPRDIEPPDGWPERRSGSDRVHTPGAAAVAANARPAKRKVRRPKPNPDYDPAAAYAMRSDRPEWAVVEMGKGKVRLRKESPKHPHWVKLRDISDAVELWLVR